MICERHANAFTRGRPSRCLAAAKKIRLAATLRRLGREGQMPEVKKGLAAARMRVKEQTERLQQEQRHAAERRRLSEGRVSELARFVAKSLSLWRRHCSSEPAP